MFRFFYANQAEPQSATQPADQKKIDQQVTTIIGAADLGMGGYNSLGQIDRKSSRIKQSNNKIEKPEEREQEIYQLTQNIFNSFR